MKTFCTLTLVAGLGLASSATAAPLLSISTDQGSINTGTGVTDRYDAAAVTITSDPGVVALTAADLISDASDGTGITGLTRFWNNPAGGFFSLDSNSGSTTNISDFSTGYFAFTVEATPGQTLNLDDLAFNSATFTSNNRRGFEVYAEVDGGTFDSSDLLIDVNDENTARPSVSPRLSDLSDAKYQGIESVEFRIYPLTDLVGRSIEFQDIVVSGTVVPEPASLVLVGAGLLCLTRGRGRRNA